MCDFSDRSTDGGNWVLYKDISGYPLMFSQTLQFPAYDFGEDLLSKHYRESDHHH